MAWDVEEAPYSDSYNSSRSVKTGAHNAHIALSLERPKCPRKTPIQTSSYVSHGSSLFQIGKSLGYGKSLFLFGSITHAVGSSHREPHFEHSLDVMIS